MKIMVFDVPAESGGALSILHDFFQEVHCLDDADLQWCFVLGKAELQEAENIKILRFPWLKKSWLHRLFFDHIVAPGLLRKDRPDMILSLQNVVAPYTRIFQVLYVHQLLPVVDFKFKIHENFILWMHQNIIGRIIFRSIKKADKVIVQTRWMKKACIEKTGVDEAKIEVVPPRISLEPKAFFMPTKSALSTFFYPAAAYSYKNHAVVVEACEILTRQGFTDFRVVFTLHGDESGQIKKLVQLTQKKNLPLEFTGALAREEVFDLYTRSILIFPSFIETFGLPMLEAKAHNGFIIASDCPFSHEILDGYENAYFFDPFDADMLASLMGKALTNVINYVEPQETPKNKMKETLLSKILELCRMSRNSRSK